MQVKEEEYYEEILIEIDGWVWNLKERSRARFPSTEKLLKLWERDRRR